MPDACSVAVAGTVLTLLPERAAYWDDADTLLVADVHLGKDATFRAEAVPLPLGSTRSDLDRLSRLLQRTEAERLVVLGDLYHAAVGMTEPTLDALRGWRQKHRSLDVVLVPGNHDRHAGASSSDLDIAEHAAPLIDPPFVFRHEPLASEAGYVVAGHLHPGATVRGPGRQRERLACYHATPDRLVLPAFSELTGLYMVERRPSDQTFVIAGDEVLPCD